MKLRELFDVVPIHSRLVLEVVDDDRNTHEERKAGAWCDAVMPGEFDPFADCELFDLKGDVSGVLRIVVTSLERIEKRRGNGWYYYTEDGTKYELAELVVPDGSADHDMMVIMQWYDNDDGFGYNIIDYFVGGAEMSEEELLDKCRYYVRWNREKNRCR